MIKKAVFSLVFLLSLPVRADMDIDTTVTITQGEQVTILRKTTRIPENEKEITCIAEGSICVTGEVTEKRDDGVVLGLQVSEVNQDGTISVVSVSDVNLSFDHAVRIPVDQLQPEQEKRDVVVEILVTQTQE